MRYALSGTAGRPLALLVNGVQKATFTIPATASWTTWATETKTIALTAGNHTISLKTTGQSGPNFDRMDITAIATAASSANSSVASSSRASASSVIAVTSSSKPSSSSSSAISSSSASSQTPVATLYFVHNDHLGTPQVMTSKNQAVVYMADYQPFGKLQQGQANSMELYSRFPGQSLDAETGLYYNYFRDYDPSIGRYMESDPIGLAGGINTYEYVKGNPIYYVDFFGLKPGDPYPSADAAGIQAIKDINPKSIRNSVEYAGRVYRKRDGTYSYTKPRKGTKDSSNSGRCPPFTYNEGYYHTHGGPLPGYDDENYSDDDMDSNDNENKPGYLGTPTGEIYKYSPVPGSPRGGTVINLGSGAN